MAVQGIERRGHDYEPCTFFSRKCRNGRFKIIGRGLKRHTRHLDAKPRRHSLDSAPHPGKSLEGRIRNTCHPLETGRNLFQQLQPFPPDFRFECAEAGNVGAWPGETLHCPSAHRVDNRNKDHRDCARGFIQGCERRCTVSQDDVWFQRHQFRYEGSRSARVTRAPSILHRNIAALGPTQPLQSLPKGDNTSLCFGIILGVGREHTDPAHALALLRARRERPCDCRTAKKGYELASPHGGVPQGLRSRAKYSRSRRASQQKRAAHVRSGSKAALAPCRLQCPVCPKADNQARYSMTSSARASNDGGTSMPSALAVFKLITNSYLVGFCTGRSAGFSPLRMRSTYPAARRCGSIASAP